jgi:uncharacterized protein YqgC (DUF456 family)
MNETLLTALIGLAMLLGLVAVFIPLMPEMLILWGASLAYGLLVGWGRWGPWLFALITLLGLLGALAEIWASSAGGKRAGASLWGILGGLVAGFLAGLPELPAVRGGGGAAARDVCGGGNSDGRCR